MVDEKAVEIGREAIARMKDADEAPHSAALIRSGKWDDVSEVAMAIAGARLALQALSPGSTGETEGWVLVPKEPTEAMMDAAIAVTEKPCFPQDIYSAMLSAAGER